MPGVYVLEADNKLAIKYLGDFHSYKQHKDMGGTSANYDKYSKRIFDFKENSQKVVEAFAAIIDPLLASDFSVCVVPSHEAMKTTGPLYNLARILCAKNNRVNATGCLVRNKTIQKLSHGGNRDISTHLNSIIPMQTTLISGKRVLLLDDVSTTGNSLTACRTILVRAGAAGVWSLALAQTV